MHPELIIHVIPYQARARARHVTYRQVLKACGKPACRVCGGTAKKHGPYWYKSVWDPRRQRTRTVYVGKALPQEAAEVLHAQHLLPALRQRVAQLEAALAAARSRCRPAGPREGT